MRRRGCLTVFGGLIGLILLCCVIGYFFGIPRLQDNIADSLTDELSTQVSNQLGTTPTGPGTYELDVAQIENELRANLNGQSVEDVELSIAPDGTVDLSFTSGEQDIGYTGRIAAENGELVIHDMESNNDVLGFFLPADKLAGAVEKGVNEYFQNQGLQIASVTPGNDVLTIEVVQG